MWDCTALDWQFPLLRRIAGSMMIYTLYSQRLRSVESHICQNRADMGHPSFVTGRERPVCEKSRLSWCRDLIQLHIAYSVDVKRIVYVAFGVESVEGIAIVLVERKPQLDPLWQIGI
jgi:hypothetical protein